MSENVVDQLDSSTEPQLKRMPYALRYGSIAALLGIIYGLILFFVGQEYNRSLGFVGLIFPVILVVMAMKAYKNDNHHRMRGGQAFGLGMMFFLVYAVITTIYFLLYVGFINPDFTAGLLEMTEEKLEDRGLSDEMVEQQMKMTAIFMKPVALAIFTVIQTLVVGLIISGIAAPILKSHKKS